MSRILVSSLLVVAALYLGICIALWVFQRALIYFPQPLSGSATDLLTLSVDEARVRVSVRPHDGPQALIYFGGNAEDVSLNMPGLARAFPDHALYLLHYRGYGGSSGSPSEEALQRDAQALFDRVWAEHPEILLVGRSLGSGVAVRLASQRPASRLILISPYNSLQDIAAAQFPFFPVRWLLRDKFESWKYAPRIRVPTLLILAEHDRVIPRASSETLLARFAPGVATLKVVPGADHNSISQHSEYFQLLHGSATTGSSINRKERLP
ncbi:MAG: alpha/beta fold hydrolase [Pseudomonadota bacterium]